MLTLALLLLIAPLVGFCLQYCFGRRLPRQGDWLTVLTIGTSLVCSLIIFFKVMGGESLNRAWDWFNPGTGESAWSVGIYIDGLTAVMLVVVTLVAFLVHVFSIGYMKGDKKYWAFFAWLQMFSVSMLILVLANNLLHLFMGWELVGLCSYKLIGFWNEKPDPCNASRKAFITTRIGDVGMLIAIMAIYKNVGSFDFTAVREAVATGSFGGPWLTISGLGLFFAAMGKSAQLPLHVWLPDAMEGPTPVSALIHAATMVAAGVYLIGRFMPILTPEALVVIATVGAVTALMAGFIALAQDDIKRVLAYSTISQLGYMFLGLGVGAWHAALFHLTTHAFFKALMFLGSGSVIHACHHEQDMRKMGGLWKKMPITGSTFFFGVLAIAGVPFISGFYSKDAILAGAYHRYPALFYVGLCAAVLTAFYMMRLFVMTFMGKPKDKHVYDHAHESPFSMTFPLIVLGILAIAAGWGAWHSTLLNPSLVSEAGLTAVGQPAASHPGVATVGDLDHFEHDSTVATLAITAGLSGLLLGFLIFGVMGARVPALKKPLRAFERAFHNKFYFDELYREVILRPAYAIADLFRAADEYGVDGLVNAIGRGGKRTARASGSVDDHVVDGVVRGTGAVSRVLGAGVSATQSGRVRLYLSLSVGALALALLLRWVF